MYIRYVKIIWRVHMSTNFEFLKEYDKFAYKWAKNMERTLHKEPLGALAYGGRFIESIRTALYQKHYKTMSKYNKNLSKSSEDVGINTLSFKQDDLAKHISDLYHAKVIKATDSYKIIHAYNIRHKLHENEDVDDIESDKKAALELYKEVFEIAVWFCKHIDNTFNDEIAFSYPDIDENNDEIPNVDIVKIFDYCVLCGERNISPNRNICPECYRKIRLASDLDDLMDLLNNENRFTLDFLKLHSYDKYEIEYTLHFLKQYELISRESGGEYFINKNKAYDFIEEKMSYEDIEKILLAFYNELIDWEDIDYGDGSFYELGEKGELYNQFYLLIITKKIKHYLNLKSKNTMNACEKSGVNITEISNWYLRKVKKILKSNYKRERDISFNQMSRILMNKWLEYRENNVKKEEIKEKLKLNDTVLDFWLDESLIGNSKYPYITEFIYKNRAIEMKLFVEGLNLGLNKQEAIEFADTSLEFVNKFFNLNNAKTLIKRWRIGKQINNEESLKTYKNVYFHNKTKEFLDYLKGDEINSALINADLDEEDFNNWYSWGKREFFKYNCDLENDLFKFYIRTNKVLMENWLSQRRRGHKKLESCKNIGLYSDTLDEWFEFENEDFKDFEINPKYKIFRDFYKDNHKLEMDLVIESIENGDTRARAAKNADISLEVIEEYYELGRENNEEYRNFYEKYEEIYLPKRRDEFIKLFVSKEDYKKALNASELSEEEIEYAYEHGKMGEEEFKDFYEDLLDAKLTLYASKLSRNEKEKRALEKSNLTAEEIEEYDYRIEILTLIENMDRITAQNIKNRKLEKILSKCSFDMKDVFEWYEKGKKQYEDDETLEYLFFREIVESPEPTFGDYILKDKDYKENTEEDFDSYYRNFYNVFYELNIRVTCNIITRLLHEGENLKLVLKSTKISKKEFNFWDEMGLIKRGDEAAEMIEERKNALKANKLFDAEQWEECIEYYRKANEINPSNREYIKMQASCYEKLGEYEKAIEIYDQLLGMKHYYTRYWYEKAVCLNELEKYEEALESCEEAIEFNPDNEEYLGFRASVLINLGRLDDALETLSSTEKTIDLEISADDLKKIKEIVESPEYTENIGKILISKDLDKYFDKDDLNAVQMDIEDLDEFLEALKTGILPEMNK